MRGLSGHDVLRAWERGQQQHVVDRALTLLGLGAPSASCEDLAALPIGRRDALLLDLHAATFGPSVRAFCECPDCAERLELELDVPGLRVACEPARTPDDEIDMGGYHVRVRPPTSDDLAAAVRAGAREAAHRTLLERCLSARTADGAPVAIPLLPDVVVAAAADHVLVVDHGVELVVDVSCPACRRSASLVLDVPRFVWAEVTAEAKRLLSEVYALARSTGWSEDDILRMSPQRRRAYLELGAA